jgi:hypothetical protein
MWQYYAVAALIIAALLIGASGATRSTAMAKTGEKSKEEARKALMPTKHICEKCGQVITIGEMFPVKDGLRRKMMYYHKKCFA